MDVLEHDGTTEVHPVEYKVGRPKPDDRDKVQVCAQCICLEEMLGTKIDRAYLYYHQTRRRYEIEMSEGLRETTRRTAEEMHALFEKGITPPPSGNKSCEACSLFDKCMPSLGRKWVSVKEYVQKETAAR